MMNRSANLASRSVVGAPTNVRSGSITPSQKSGRQSSAAATQDNEGHKSENHRSHHHDCETVRGSYKIQKGLDLWARIARSRLLDLFHHFASYFGAFVEQSHGQDL